MLLKGKEVAQEIIQDCKTKTDELKAKGVTPTLAIIRVGEKPDDLSYEKGATKRCNEVGIDIKNVVFDENVEEKQFFDKLEEINNDPNIHGILMFRPLPKHLDSEQARKAINPSKDVDGCSDISLAGVFCKSNIGFAPCTAQAAIEILDYYGIDVQSKNVVVIGRSLVIGKPVSMMLLNKNATVTICHTKTKDITSISKNADIIICATGQMESIDSSYVSNKQTIIDVGISYNEEKQKLCGDCLFEEVEPIVENITPVPGGVGSVTTSVLVKHVVEAAMRTVE